MSRRHVPPQALFEPVDQESARAKLRLPDDVRILIASTSNKLLQPMLVKKTRGVSEAFRRVEIQELVKIVEIQSPVPLPPGRRHHRTGEERSSAAVVPHQAFEPDARARAILRGIRKSRQDLAETGGSYSLENVQELLGGITRQAVDRRVRDRKLLVVPGPGGARRFPVIQFGRNGEPIRGLDRIQEALGYSSPWAVLNFLANGQPDLDGVSPIEAIRSGRMDDVLVLARSVGVGGA